jgi:hypothetical protein
MTTNSGRARLGALAVSMALLGGCGGGGGGGDGDSEDETGAPVTVSSSNYEAVAVEAAEATTSANNSSSWGQQLTGVQASRRPDWLQFGLSQLSRLSALGSVSPAGPALLVGIQRSQSYNCDVSGTFTAAFNDSNNNNALDAGELATLAFSNCVDSSGSRVNGSLGVLLHMTTVGTPGVTATYQMDATLTFDRLRAVDASGDQQVHGSMRFATHRTSVNVGQDRLECPSLSLQEIVAGQTVKHSLTNMVFQQTYTGNEVAETYSATKINLGGQGGRHVSLSTPATLRRRIGQTYPYTGKMVFTGVNGSAAVLQVLDASQVQLSYDATNDGVYESSVIRSWTNIDW